MQSQYLCFLHRGLGLLSAPFGSAKHRNPS